MLALDTGARVTASAWRWGNACRLKPARPSQLPVQYLSRQANRVRSDALLCRRRVSCPKHSSFFQCMGNEMAAGSSASRAFVEKEIADNKVVVFS